jgi:hypothetical protein
MFRRAGRVREPFVWSLAWGHSLTLTPPLPSLSFAFSLSLFLFLFLFLFYLHHPLPSRPFGFSDADDASLLGGRGGRGAADDRFGALEDEGLAAAAKSR